MRCGLRISCRTVIYVAIVGLLWSRGQITVASAQGPTSDWATPVKVSNVAGPTGYTIITGDAKGNVYVLWAGDSAGLKSEAGHFEAPDTIYLRTYDGRNWSDSVDVLAFPATDSFFGLDTFLVDAYGRLVLLWHRGSELQLSVAQPAQAMRASGWRTLTVSSGETVYSAELKSGRDGSLAVLMAGIGQNIYYYRSSDAGQTWRMLSRPSVGNDPAYQVGEGTFLIGEDGVLHATWTEHAKEFNWTGAAILYARSKDQGATWSEPTRLVNAVGNDYSGLSSDGKGNLWTFWDRSVGSKDGRYYARSKDNGLTWSGRILSYDSINISGMSGSAFMFWDSAGQLRLLNGGYGPNGSELWESRWQGQGWAPPVPVTVSGRLTGSEVYSAALVGGNRLLLVWVDFGTKDVWFTSKTYSAPSTTDTFLEVPTPATGVARTATPSVALGAATRSARTVDPTTPPIDEIQSPVMSPLVAGVVPVAGLLFVLIIARLRHRP
jgi:hypothetical protein